MGLAVVQLALMLRTLLGPSLLDGVDGGSSPPAHFLAQDKRECHFADGARQVRLLARYVYGRQEVARYDSRLGRYEAVTELEEDDVRRWNGDPERLRRMRAEVELFCRRLYGVLRGSVATRKAQPTVRISPTKASPASPHTLLLCTVTGFYPAGAAVQWLKNGQEQTEGAAFGEELQNGDWTFQTQAMLEARPGRGDVYACRVEHASLEGPVTVQWEPRTSDSARIKVWAGAVGALLGVAFVALGLYLHWKRKKGPWVGAAGPLPSPHPAAESALEPTTLE